MKVGALFVDYDGTIAPLGVPRRKSRVFRRVEFELRNIVRKIPVGIVTAKDFEFIHPRTSFADGWACVSGLDIRTRDGTTHTSRKLASLDAPLRIARALERRGCTIELKRGPSRELLALAIDWRGKPELGPAVVRRLRPLLKSRTLTVQFGSSPFADVYAARPDKGRAVRILKKILSVEDYTAFIGDSSLDNPAFQEADIAIGICYGQPLEDLRCGFIVEQEKLAGFLRSLSDREMEFTPSVPFVSKRERV